MSDEDIAHDEEIFRNALLIIRDYDFDDGETPGKWGWWDGWAAVDVLKDIAREALAKATP